MPLDKVYHIKDDTRMCVAALKTINYILDGGEPSYFSPNWADWKLNLKADGSIDKENLPCDPAPHLAELLVVDRSSFCDDLRGDKLKSQRKLQPGEVLPMENTRFETGRRKCDP
ncbi:MAG: phosphoglycerate kinase [Saprospiraceae bacterium]|nr:phosphoglycerate kinase [Saprospiraceae bacterium]